MVLARRDAPSPRGCGSWGDLLLAGRLTTMHATRHRQFQRSGGYPERMLRAVRNMPHATSSWAFMSRLTAVYP